MTRPLPRPNRYAPRAPLGGVLEPIARPHVPTSDRTRRELQSMFAIGVADTALLNDAEWPALSRMVREDGPTRSHRDQSADVRAMLFTLTMMR